MWNWAYRAKIAAGQFEMKNREEPGIPFDCLNHEYVGGSTFLKKPTEQEIIKRREKVKKLLAKYGD
jgi:hypothetical protein